MTQLRSSGNPNVGDQGNIHVRVFVFFFFFFFVFKTFKRINKIPTKLCRLDSTCYVTIVSMATTSRENIKQKLTSRFIFVYFCSLLFIVVYCCLLLFIFVYFCLLLFCLFIIKKKPQMGFDLW